VESADNLAILSPIENICRLGKNSMVLRSRHYTGVVESVGA
jgi:hypothetical protein